MPRQLSRQETWTKVIGSLVGTVFLDLHFHTFQK